MTPFGSIATITGAALEKQRGVKNVKKKKKNLHEHFLQDEHHGFLNAAMVTLMDKTQVSDPIRGVYLDENP